MVYATNGHHALLEGGCEWQESRVDGSIHSSENGHHALLLGGCEWQGLGLMAESIVQRTGTIHCLKVDAHDRL
jgi:hypothetical protein